MSKIKSKDTKAEFLIRHRLYSKGFRYRIHSSGVFGKPDIVFGKYKIAVFIDGDWWHGRNYKKEFLKYPLFWQKKIDQNIRRDRKVNRRLKADGWRIVRLWQKDIEKDPNRCLEKIIKVLPKKIEKT